MCVVSLDVTKACKRQAFCKLDRRQQLLTEAIDRHGVPAVAFLLELIEADDGDLRIDARLERLADLDESAFADAARLLAGRRRR